MASVSECAPLAAAVITDGLAALAAVVLQQNCHSQRKYLFESIVFLFEVYVIYHISHLAQSNLLLVVHRLQVPEERPANQQIKITHKKHNFLRSCDSRLGHGDEFLISRCNKDV